MGGVAFYDLGCFCAVLLFYPIQGFSIGYFGQNITFFGNTNILTLPLILSIVLASYFVGSAYLRIIGFSPDISERNLFSFVIGWGILAYLAMGLAAVGLLNENYVVGLLSTVIIAGFLKWRTVYRRFLLVPVSIRAVWSNSNGIEKCMWIILLWIFAWNILDVLAPPSVADSLAYHFRIPYEYVKAAKLVYNPFLPHNAPHLAEFFSVFSFVFDNEISAQAQFYFFNVILAWLIITFASKYFDRITGLLAAVIFFSLPEITDIKSAGYVEIALLVCTFGSLWAVWEGFCGAKEHSRAWFILAGSLLGLACSIKYYGLFSLFVVSLFVVFIVIRLKLNNESVGLTRVLWFCLAILIFGGPFYIKNFLFTGNPLYPAFYEFLGGIDWSIEKETLFKAMVHAQKMPLGHSFLAFLASPWNITMNGIKIGGFGTGFGPFYVALVPVLFCGVYRTFSSVQRKMFSWAVAYCVIFWIMWFFGAFQRGRHLLPVFFILTFIFAVFIRRLFLERDIKYIWWKYGVLIALVSCLGFNLAVHGVFNAQFLKVAFGLENNESFLARKLWYYEDMVWANQNLPMDAKVLNYVNAIGYYLKRDMVYVSPHFQGHFDFEKYLSVDEFYAQLKEEGYTHIITLHNPMNQNSGKYYQFHNALIQNWGREIYQRKGQAFLRRTLLDRKKDVWVGIYELG